MAEKLEIYKCEICGNIVEVLHGGKGQLVCCNQPMSLMEEQTAEMAKEKHVPVIEKNGTDVRVYVGSTLHPMEEKHYIEWIQVITADGKLSLRKFLQPGDEPQAVFHLCKNCIDELKAREYCNIHKLWKG
jgi:superoxide reductase